MDKFDIVTVGDSILDTFLTLEKATEFARLRKETDELCIKEGAKVLVESADFCLGGNATNVGVGLSRLGLKTALFAELGDDEFAEKIVNAMKKEAIHMQHIIHTKGAPSTFSVILNLLGDRIAFIRHVQREHKFHFDRVKTDWVYLTSIGKQWHPLYQHVHNFVMSTDAKLAFNPGSAQIHEGREAFIGILKATDILFVNRDEAEIILHGKIPEKSLQETEENLLFRLQRMGPKIIVMTDGKKGAYCMTDTGELLFEKAQEAEVVERTGAGDAFASGFLGAVLSGKGYKEALLWGAYNSAGVLGKVGGEAGLLTKAEMERKVKQG